MPACHAGGHEFESRTHRRVHQDVNLGGFLFYVRISKDFLAKCLWFRIFVVILQPKLEHIRQNDKTVYVWNRRIHRE